MMLLKFLKKEIIKIISILLFFTTCLKVSANNHWTEEFDSVFGHVVIQGKNFTSFRVKDKTYLDIFYNGKWRHLDLHHDDFIPWDKNFPLIIKTNKKKEEIIFVKTNNNKKNIVVSSGSFIGDNLRVFTRDEWGADDSYLFKQKGLEYKNISDDNCKQVKEDHPQDFKISKTNKFINNKELIWENSYSKNIKKIIVHHTAGAGKNSGLSSSTIMKNIYYGHAVANGWGDVGYHFIIGYDGKIFEGKSGGDFIVGGHVKCANISTIGIALMGNFQYEEPNELQKIALRKLLQVLEKKYNIDLQDKSYFQGKYSDNLLGHKDLDNTLCPGDFLYDFLHDILKSRTDGLDGIFVGSNDDILISAGGKKKINLQFKNTGEQPWDKNTWLFMSSSDDIFINGNKKYFAGFMEETLVKRGEVAHFNFEVEAGYFINDSVVIFTPVVNGNKIKSASMLQNFKIKQSNITAEFIKIDLPKVVYKNKKIDFRVYLENHSDIVLRNNYASMILIGNNKVFEGKLLNIVSINKTAIFEFKDVVFDKLGSNDMEFILMLGNSKTKIKDNKNILIIDREKTGEILINNKNLELEVDKNHNITIEVINKDNIFWQQKHLTLEVDNKAYKPKQKIIQKNKKAVFSIILNNKKSGIKHFNLKFFYKDELIDKKILIARFYKNNNNIKIKLSFPEDKNSIILSSNDYLKIVNNNGDLIDLTNSDASFYIDDNSLIYKNDKISEVFYIKNTNKDGIIKINNWDRFPKWDTNKRWNDNEFFGDLELRIENGKILLINDIPLYKYMLGLAETTDNDEEEKRKALAVASRTYAFFYMQNQNRKYKTSIYDGDDSPKSFQKYLGANYTKRSPKWVSIVENTEGQILTIDNKVIKTPYHSCSGGKILSAKDVWGWSHTDYLISKVDIGGLGKESSGHRVGLSGCGAEFLAEKGKNYKDILKFYYIGANILNIKDL